ncbi:MAG: class I SAM-dependent methyltransferase [Prevotella sp.]|nr:class I SAM-dependent methyltransferase [Prevotella sp.]
MDIQMVELSERLKIIGKYYDLDALLEGKPDNEVTEKYYRYTEFFYNRVLSHGLGSMHLGLSDDGFYKKEDYYKQAQYVSGFIDNPSIRVLEVGGGQLINTKYLAKMFPQNQFTALDLPNRGFLKKRAPKNVTLVEGDYNDLSIFPENSFDIVFGVETICYAEDKKHVYGEIYRVLKPGGKLIVFDGYNMKPLNEMTDFEKRVAFLIWTSTRVNSKDMCIGDIVRYIEELHYKNVEVTDLSKQIRPTLRRLDRICTYYYMHPRFMKFLRKFIADEVTMNSIFGWLTFFSTDGEKFGCYARIVATK